MRDYLKRLWAWFRFYLARKRLERAMIKEFGRENVNRRGMVMELVRTPFGTTWVCYDPEERERQAQMTPEERDREMYRTHGFPEISEAEVAKLFEHLNAWDGKPEHWDDKIQRT